MSNPMLEDRLEQLGLEWEETGEYKRLNEQENRYFDILMATLPEELKLVLIRYSDIFNELLGSAEEFFYMRGYGDCFIENTNK